MAAPVTELMTNRPVKIDRLKERGRGGNLDVIGARKIESAVAIDADIGAGRSDQRLGLRQDQVFGDRFRRRRDLGRKTLELVGVEDREALQKRDRFGLVAGFRGAGALAIGNEAIGIDDRGAAFAFPDTRAELERLAEGSQFWPEKPRSVQAIHRIRTLMPL
jgi:hypothetical protein